MTDSPIVTIGLPVYNSEKYVEQSLKSLLSQTYENFILIISDNASTDSTGQICQDYAKADSRIRYHRNETNTGNPRNFNRIVELTTTPYLKWSTADDYWAPTFLERAMEVMESDPTVALCFPKAVIVDAKGENPKFYDDPLKVLQFEDPAERFMTLIKDIKLAHQHLGVIRMSRLRQTHLLGTYVGSDINLLAELSLYGKFVELPERLFFRRMHKDSGSWKRGDRAHEARRYHAAAKQVGFPRWRTEFAFYAAVGASNLPTSSKFRLYRRLARRLVWNRQVLMSELTHSIFG